jgi:HD-GYP domain-containing protein (c-di-GMP phosphodiesterase class II)
MSELQGRAFLQALARAGERTRSHPDGHTSVEDALAALERAVETLTTSSGEVVLTVAEGAFFLGPEMLPHASVEFNGLLRRMERLGIESVTVLYEPDTQDLADLAALVVGASSDLPVGGTVRLNERPLKSSDLRVVPVARLRTAYASSLEALRDFAGGAQLGLGGVMDVVDGLVGREPGPSLMMANVHNHDETTFYHSVNVCLLSLALGRSIGCNPETLRLLGTSALLHDIGRVVLPEVSLTKEGRLTNEEWAEVRLHPQEGAQAILAASGPGQEVAAAVALEHHLRLDGQGYPDLGEREPHLFSRIVAVADTYDAITSPRPYRTARTSLEALRVVLDGAGTAFDPDLSRAFLHLVGAYPPGSLLRLETGEVVMVTPSPEGEQALRAVVVRDPSGAVVEDPQPLDLEGRAVVEQLLADEAGIDPAALLELVDD